MTMRDDGTVRIAVEGCAFAGVGHWQLTDQHLQLDVAVPDCTIRNADFRSWLVGMNGAGAEISFHVGETGGMWTLIDGQVARLVPSAPSLHHALGDDATPAAAGLRVAEWNGAGLESLGVILDEAHLGVRMDGALVSLSGDGGRLTVVSDRGVVEQVVFLDPGFSRMTVHPVDIASLVGVSGASRVSLQDTTFGASAAPAARVDMRGPNADCTYDVEVSGQRWIVPRRDCTTALLDPVALGQRLRDRAHPGRCCQRSGHRTR